MERRAWKGWRREGGTNLDTDLFIRGHNEIICLSARTISRTHLSARQSSCSVKPARAAKTQHLRTPGLIEAVLMLPRAISNVSSAYLAGQTLKKETGVKVDPSKNGRF